MLYIRKLAFSYIIGSYWNWHIQAIATGVIPIIGCFMLTFIPESPYYLMEKNDVKGAIKSLCWLRGVDVESCHLISDEIEEVIFRHALH